jgi:hypothetical protein
MGGTAGLNGLGAGTFGSSAIPAGVSQVAPTSVPTAYAEVLPSAVPTSGQVRTVTAVNSVTGGSQVVEGWATPSGGSAITALTGDVTASGPGSAAATLATVNGSPGSCGDSTHVCQVTTNGKGLTTAQTAVAIAGGAGALTANVLNSDVGTSNFIATGPSEGLILHGGYPEKLATNLGIPSGNWNINVLGSGSEPDWFSCSNSLCSPAGAVYQNGTWPLTFPLGVTALTKTLIFGGFNSVSAWSGSPTTAQLDYFRGHWLAWSILYGVPDSLKYTASANCTTTGTWASAGAGFPSGSLTNTSGSGTLTCTNFNANDAGIIFVKKVSDTATFTLSVNGTPVLDPSTASATIPTSAPYTGSLGGTSDLYALGTGNTLPGGLATIVLTVTASSGGNAITVVAPFGLTPLSDITNSPPVLIGLAPYQCNNGVSAGSCSPAANHSDAQINQARVQQQAVVKELRGLLNVGIFDMNAATNGVNPNSITDMGSVVQYTVTAGGTGFGTPVVTFNTTNCTIAPTATGANLPTVSGGSLVASTYYVTTNGACTGTPGVTITGGSGATATAAYSQDFVHPNYISGPKAALLAQNALNSAPTLADKYNYSPTAAATTPGGASGSIQYNNGGAFGGSSATVDAPGNVVLKTLGLLSTTAPTSRANPIFNLSLANSVYPSIVQNTDGSTYTFGYGQLSLQLFVTMDGFTAHNQYAMYLNGIPNSPSSPSNSTQVFSPDGIIQGNGEVYGWNVNAGAWTGTGGGALSAQMDTGLSRASAGVIVAGNGTPGDHSGTFTADNHIAGVAYLLSPTGKIEWNAGDTTLSRASAGVVSLDTNTSGNGLGSLLLANVTDSALTSGNCVQAGTAGILANAGQPCVTRTPHYWSIQPTLFATSTMLGPAYIADTTSGSAFFFVARLSGTISCTVAPSVSIMDLGTSPTTVFGSATTAFTQGTGTSDGVFFTNSPTGTIVAGHYYGLAFSAGTCVTAPTIDVTLNW